MEVGGRERQVKIAILNSKSKSRHNHNFIRITQTCTNCITKLDIRVTIISKSNYNNNFITQNYNKHLSCSDMKIPQFQYSHIKIFLSHWHAWRKRGTQNCYNTLISYFCLNCPVLKTSKIWHLWHRWKTPITTLRGIVIGEIIFGGQIFIRWAASVVEVNIYFSCLSQKDNNKLLEKHSHQLVPDREIWNMGSPPCKLRLASIRNWELYILFHIPR